MTALQTINLGTAPAGSDGDSVRTAFVKENYNIAVLQSQQVLTSTTLITSPQALTTGHIGKRVNINLGSAGTINLPSASTCAADQVTLLRNLGTTVVTLAVTSGSGDTVSVSKLNPGETALMDTDGAHAWTCLMRGRTNSDNETVNGNCTVVGNATVGGSLSVTGATTLSGGVSGATTFSARPTFASNTPWDTGNFTPANYVARSNVGTFYATGGTETDLGVTFQDRLTSTFTASDNNVHITASLFIQIPSGVGYTGPIDFVAQLVIYDTVTSTNVLVGASNVASLNNLSTYSGIASAGNLFCCVSSASLVVGRSYIAKLQVQKTQAQGPIYPKGMCIAGIMV
jgi:hypothetical protein